MSLTFNRVTDFVSKIEAVHVNELQLAVENHDVTLSSIDSVVAASLAKDSTPAQAAADAVTNEIANRPILEGGAIVEDSPIFAVVDQDGRRTWLEVGLDGGLTQHAVDKIGQFINGTVEQNTAITGLSFAIVDNDGRRTWLEADEAGKPTQRVLSLISAGIGAAAQRPTYPTDDWAHWGDSLTAGAGGTPYPQQMATLTGKDHYNGGWGGQGTHSIAARQGGVPCRVTLSGGQIPASGPVAVTSVIRNPLSPNGSRPGTIMGVTGTLSSDASNNLTFTRDTAGSVVAVPAKTYFLPTDGTTRRDRHIVIWTGRNDFKYIAFEQVIQDIRQMIDYFTPDVRRVIVLSIPPDAPETTGTPTRATLDAANQALASAFAPYYLDIAAYLRTNQAATDAGITFTTQDNTDISNGVTPTSLRSDTLHLNTAGYLAVAKRVYSEAQTRGWL